MWKDAINRYFPGALAGPTFTEKVIEYLKEQKGFTPENTVFGHSTCPDEINRKVTAFSNYYGENFTLGGLAGYPFTGVTGFGAFSHHAPDNGALGNLFVLYGPHIGVNEQGDLTKVRRKGMDKDSTACGSLCAAYAALEEGWQQGKLPLIEFDPTDRQQGSVMRLLTNHLPGLTRSENKPKAVVEAMYSEIDSGINAILADKRTSFRGTIALVGGIQINTPNGQPDYFLPKRLELYNMATGDRKDLLHILQN